MHSPEDDVVTLSTIHAAKGLEWPVVVVIKGDEEIWREPTNELKTDPSLGPLIVPKKDGRGGRALQIVEREKLEERAEASRLLYVALTRARDRVVVTGYEKFRDGSFWTWTKSAIESGILTRVEPEVLPHEVPIGINLEWLDRVEEGASELMVTSRPIPPSRWLSSATELMLLDKDPEAWERKYLHGAMASWEFTPKLGDEPVPSHVRGTVIHGVLERIQEESELAQLLDATIGALDDPDVENALGAGSAYREALEKEISVLLATKEWKELTEHEHHRELSFVHLAADRAWRAGALDLYRPGEQTSLVVDFKTHSAKSAQEAREIEKGYEVQAQVYAFAAGLRGPATVRFVFTAVVGHEA
jgi:ATP-dependent exoDNAse (exonuclease V) beta subunit